ncbi:MAG: hypothetical protein AMS27_07275 [Bacteroides sp. SM23_62_1]|nr:MAG: hypothetical protein AMS27_07275 [Bacteroides sp. SM23_62_1]
MIIPQHIIRDYDPADYDQLLELWNLTGLNYPERGDDGIVIERCITMGGKLLIMVEATENKLIGSSWMTYDGRRIHLHHFAIHPDYQNRGLGKILTRESLRFVRKMGQQVKLEVHKENKIAKHLYEKFGFFAFTDYDIYMLRDPDNLNL